MNILRYAPLSMKGLDPFFQGLFSEGSPFSRLTSFGTSPAEGASGIAADLYEDEGSFYVRLEMPGVKRDEVRVKLDGDELTVSFDRSLGSDENEEGGVSFRRQIRLPEGSDGGKISAALSEGILTVTVPKEEAQKPRTIEVN